MAGALEDGKVTPDTAFDLPPQIQVADRTIGESHPRGYDRPLDHAEILAESCNVGTIMIGQREGKDALRPLGAPLRLRQADRRRPARARSTGIVLHASKYSGSSMGNLPIGQGLAVTPMQMAAALRRDRQRRRPAPAAHRRGGRRPVGEEAQGPPRDLRRRPPASCARCSRACSAPGGTATGAAIAGYQAGGQDRHREQARPGHGRLLGDASSSPRSSASRPPRTRACSSP